MAKQGRMSKEERALVDKLCLGVCDGCEGRCQRYPHLANTCDQFILIKKAYELGLVEELDA